MLFYLYMLILFLAPLPLGSNRPWSWFALAALLMGLAAIEALLLAFGRIRHSRAQLKHLALIAIPFMLVVAWASLQAFLTLDDPMRHPLWQQVDASGLGNGSNTISANAERSKIAIMLLVCYASSFFLAWCYALDPARAKTLIVCLWVAGIFHVTLGLLYIAGAIHISADFAEFPRRRLAFPFINANNMATYIGLALLAAILTYENLLRRLKITGFGPRVATFRFLEEITGKPGLYLIILLTLFGGVLLTASRTGLLATLVGIITLLGFAFFSAQINLQLKRGVVMGVGAVLIFLLVTAGHWVQKRLFEILQLGVNKASGDRPTFWSNTVDAIGDRPLLGHGYGAFQDAYPAYAQELQTKFLDKAHQTYLELIMELGIPAALLLFAVFIIMGVIFIRGFLIRQRQRMFPALGFAALVLVGLHALTDFSVQIPAVAVSFAALLGAAFVQSERTERRGKA